jgi:hypothetical protein
MRRLSFTLLLLVLVAAAIAAAWAVWRKSDPWLAEQWGRQAAEAPDDEAERLVARLAGLESAGVPVLAELLGSDRPRIAQTARQVLEDQLDRWESLPEREAADRRAVLAESLAGQVEAFSPGARQQAAELAARVLLQSIGKGTDEGRTTSACEQVFRSAVGPGPSQDRGPLADSLPLSSPENRLSPPPVPAVKEPASPPATIRLVVKPETSEPRAADAPQAEPERLPEPAPAIRVGRLPAPRPLVNQPGRINAKAAKE